MKAFEKTVFRTFFSNKGRFIGNFLVVFLSLAITAGLGALPSSFKNSFLKNYEGRNVPDITIKFLKEIDMEGFSDFSLDEFDEIKSAEPFSSIDVKNGNNDCYSRVYWLDFENGKNCIPTLVEGEYPSNENEILVENESLNRPERNIGDSIELDLSPLLDEKGAKKEYKVVGIVESPLYISVAKERAMSEEEAYVDSIYYLSTAAFAGHEDLLPPSTDISIVLNIEHDYMSDEYKIAVDDMKRQINKMLEIVAGEKDVASYLTLEENTAYALFKNYNEKVSRIALVFPFFFIVVCALINLLTITRLIKDERSEIGCYRSLGVGKGKIILKYSSFSFLSVGLGSLVGYLLGTPFVPKVVYPAYNAVFSMRPYETALFNLEGILVAIITLLISLLVTSIATLSYLKETPASLLKEKSPKAGKKILLEKIPFIWNHTPFSYKNSFRNIFRHKKNSILTSLSVIGSTILILVGFSLLNVSAALENDDLYANVAGSMGNISTVIIIFAICMAVTVIYSLANMNIQDRNRELATLKVLGYHNKECSAYTFREIMLISLFSSLIGLPIGAGLIAWVFSYLGFGGIEDVRWYSYLLSFLFVSVATIIVNLLLFPKIKRIDMNSSLKSVE